MLGGGKDMPTESLVVSLGIVAVFVIFMLALAWGSRQTGRLRKDK